MNKLNNINIILFIISLFIMISCTVGPNYEKLTFELPENYKETAIENWKIAEPNDETKKGKWWEIYQDPILNQLEEQILISNQTIASVLSQYEQAQALLEQAKSGYFPSINAQGGVTRQRTSATSLSSASESSTFNSSLNASWIPDLWGSVRRSVEANEASLQASAAQLENVKLTTQASLAQTYFQLRTADMDQKILDNIVDNNKKLLELTEQLKDTGTASLFEYNQISIQFEQSKSQATENKVTRAQYEHAIAVLLGKTPSQFSLEVKIYDFIVPTIPLLLPSKLIERRPDVAQAERLVAQANAQIGIAVAAYFPNLSISSNGGYSKSNYSDLFSLPALFWSIGSSLSETIFDGGLREQKIKAAKANYQSIASQYKQTILVAFQNVEDNIVSYNHLKFEEDFQRNAFANANTNEKIVNQGFEIGIKTYSDVINSEINSLTITKNLNELIGKRMINSVNLIASLGGSW